MIRRIVSLRIPHISCRQLCTETGNETKMMAISLTNKSSTEIATADMTSDPKVLNTGKMLKNEEIIKMISDENVNGVLLSGSGLLRSDGRTQLGARKLIDDIQKDIKLNKDKEIPFPVAMWEPLIDDPTTVLNQFFTNLLKYLGSKSK